MQWIESHLTLQQAESKGFSATAHLVNRLADDMATIASEKCQLPRKLVHQIQELDALAHSIWERLAGIVMDCAQHDTEGRKKAGRRRKASKLPKLNQLQQALSTTTHTVHIAGNRYQCSICRQKPSRTNITRWLRSPRSPPTARPAAQPGHTTKLIGDRAIHPNHAPHYFEHRGWACTRCGALGIEHLRNLQSSTCRVNRQGTTNINRLRKGLWPGQTAWAKEYNRRVTQGLPPPVRPQQRTRTPLPSSSAPAPSTAANRTSHSET